MAIRQDYFMRLIDQLRELVAEALRFNTAGRLDEAVIAVLQAQQRLFARPLDSFIGLSLDEQMDLLALGETSADTCKKWRTHAIFFEEIAKVYAAKNRPSEARGARQAALHILLTARLRQPAETDALQTDIDRVRPGIDLAELPPSLAELVAAADHAKPQT